MESSFRLIAALSGHCSESSPICEPFLCFASSDSHALDLDATGFFAEGPWEAWFGGFEDCFEEHQLVPLSGALKCARHDCKFVDSYYCGNSVDLWAKSPLINL